MGVAREAVDTKQQFLTVLVTPVLVGHIMEAPRIDTGNATCTRGWWVFLLVKLGVQDNYIRFAHSHLVLLD